MLLRGRVPGWRMVANNSRGEQSVWICIQQKIILVEQVVQNNMHGVVKHYEPTQDSVLNPTRGDVQLQLFWGSPGFVLV